MGLFTKILLLTKSLLPSGRAFRMPDNGVFRAFAEGYIPSLVSAYNNLKSIYTSVLPDNDDFTEADATFLEKRYGIYPNENTSLEDRKSALTRKITHPGNIKTRQSALYMQQQLQLAGFDVYVFENRFNEGNLFTGWDNGTFETAGFDVEPAPNVEGNVSSAGKLVNEDFDNDLSGWSVFADSEFTEATYWDSGNCSVDFPVPTGIAEKSNLRYQDFNYVTGVTYTVTVNGIASGGDFRWVLYVGNSLGDFSPIISRTFPDGEEKTFQLSFPAFNVGGELMSRIYFGTSEASTAKSGMTSNINFVRQTSNDNGITLQDLNAARTGLYGGKIVNTGVGLAGGIRSGVTAHLRKNIEYTFKAWVRFQQSAPYAYVDDPDALTYIQPILFDSSLTLIDDTQVSYSKITGNLTDWTLIESRIILLNDTEVFAGIVKGCELDDAVYGAQGIEVDDASITSSYYTKTVEEVAISPISGQVQHGQIQHGQKKHGEGYNYKIVNSLDNSVDAFFDIGDNLKSTFFISSSTLGINAVIPESREREFRELVLKLKPIQTVCFPFISITAPSPEYPLLEDGVFTIEAEDSTSIETENSYG